MELMQQTIDEGGSDYINIVNFTIFSLEFVIEMETDMLQVLHGKQQFR